MTLQETTFMGIVCLIYNLQMNHSPNLLITGIKLSISDCNIHFWFACHCVTGAT